MAALDRRVPSLDDFVGQSWTAWAEWTGVTAAEGTDVGDCSKNGKKAAEAMSLSKEDMSIFGLYPGHDDFYLVVCSHCGQVVKPQAFEKHCERRHGPLAKLYARLRSPTPAPPPQQRPHHGHSPSHGTNAASASSWESRGQGAGQPKPAPPSPSTPPQYRHSKNPKDGVRHSPLEKPSHSSHTESPVFKQPPPLEPPISSPPPSLRDPPWPHGGTPPPGRPPPSDRSPTQNQKKDSPQNSGIPNHRVPRPYNKVASKRECDLDKHCGVLDPDRKKVCTRLLTCNFSRRLRGLISGSSPITFDFDPVRPLLPHRPAPSPGPNHTSLTCSFTSSPPPSLTCSITRPPPSLTCSITRPPPPSLTCSITRPQSYLTDLLLHQFPSSLTDLLHHQIHSIHQRRKVMGRSKNFDQLVAELKTKVREKGAQSLDGNSSAGRSPSPEAPMEQAGAPHCRRPLASLPAFSRPSSVSESNTEDEQQDEGGVRAPSPLVHGKISSDESEAEGPEEPVEFPSSAAHPRPLAVCSFGSHALGHGIYTFDRRLHHLRSALSSMLEQHISAHLWKKIPQATDLHSSPPSVRTGSHINSSIKTASSTSSSSRGPGRPPTAIQTENSGVSGGSLAGGHLLSPAKPVTVRSGGSGRLKNPVGRPSKQTMKLREEAATAAAQRKRKAPSQEGEHSGPDRNCILLQDRGRPPSAASSSSSSSSKTPISSPLTHGQTNGTLSPSSKPRPQPSPSEPHSPAAKAVWTYRRTHTPLGHSSPPDPSSTNHNSHSRAGGGDSGLHLQGGGRGCEHQGLVKKRKGGGMEEHSPSKPSESKGGGLAGGVEKKLGTQKPKLHH
ncbi:Ataxin-7-like protein 2 [Dissostichus eleginoides]|uniref:Ataxin-7-like protein 2 n=1 Tax=Dissostichus eleginoides TaxID=100907 RepID=A0AAD9CHJ5_DISEL|nr:Ataxin-7-like protein 2 [Dissostichus eleginoides]